jgi:hypothetical protein
MIALLKIPLLKPVLAVTGTASVIFLALNPTVQVALIAAVSNLAVIVVGWLLRAKLNEIHVLINSRLTELVRQTGISARAEGRREGIESAQATQAVKEQGIVEGKKESER